MKLLSIFTPTYNRGYIIENLYKSLIKQNTDIEFEWIIVDDGSTDNTSEKVKEWMKIDNNFEIIYEKQENKGKHIAINRGLDLAKGKLFFIVDSDDYLAENAIERIAFWESTLNECGKEKFAGIAGCKGNGKKIIGKTFKKEFIDATTLERRKYNILGDKAEVFYTEILKKYKFPQIENEKFIAEAYVWNNIALDGYKLRWNNDILSICNYLTDGLTANSYHLAKNNPRGTLLYLKQLIDVERNLIRKIAHYSSYCEIAKNIFTEKEIVEQLNILKIQYKILIIIKKIRRKLINGKNKKNSKVYKNENIIKKQ